MSPRSPSGISRTLLVTAAASVLATACGSASPAPASPASATADPSPATSSAAPASPTSPAAAASPTPTTAPAAAAPSQRPATPADTSSPPGVSPLTDDESKEFKTQCKKFTDAVVAEAKKNRGKKSSVETVEAMLDNPPKLPGVDTSRCTALMRRDMIAFAASKREAEAKLALKRILVGLMTAMERETPLFCASAPPVPPSLDALKDKPYQSTLADWKADGWACTRFDLASIPQFFQFEVRTDAKAKTFEVIARGYPVWGAAPTELFIAGKVERGAIDPSAPVMRR